MNTFKYEIVFERARIMDSINIILFDVPWKETLALLLINYRLKNGIIIIMFNIVYLTHLSATRTMLI